MTIVKEELPLPHVLLPEPGRSEGRPKPSPLDKTQRERGPDTRKSLESIFARHEWSRGGRVARDLKVKTQGSRPSDGFRDESKIRRIVDERRTKEKENGTQTLRVVIVYGVPLNPRLIVRGKRSPREM